MNLIENPSQDNLQARFEVAWIAALAANNGDDLRALITLYGEGVVKLLYKNGWLDGLMAAMTDVSERLPKLP